MMRAAVATSHLRVTPGKPVVLDVDVTNTADIIDGVSASIQGLDAAWVSLVVPVVSLFPEASSTLSLRIDLPTNCLAGEYLVSVRVFSIIDPERFSEHEFWLSVEPLLAASLTMHPSVVIGGSHAVFQAAIANEGNVTADFVINTLDETRELNCVAYPPTVSVPPGETHTVEIHVDGKRPWFGQSTSHNVAIDASSGDLSLPAIATFTQKPRIPRGALTILILVLVVALWATVFLVVVNVLRDKPDATKAVATDFNADGKGAGGEVNLEAVGITLGGPVTADSTGEPLPLITVDAFRIKPNGEEEPVASAGTDDDGVYLLEALLPGRYKIRFSAAGFEEVWFPNAPNSAAAEILPFDPKAMRDDLGAVMIGNKGSMTGQVIAPESRGSAAAINVSIVRLDDNLEDGEVTPIAEPAPVDEFGMFALGEMITPATYRIRIEALGFDPREFDETLGAGENKVINTVTLGAAAGGFTGFVQTSAGVALGGVEITVRSGDFEKSTKTPTSGSVGAFAIDALETPRSYTLTFTLEGYTDQTISVDLGSGDTLPIPVTMTGGQGAVAGLVTDTDGVPLGGVTTEVGCGGTFSASTATLTPSSAEGQAGTYNVSEVPTPADCTITFSNPGYVSQTVRAKLEGPGTVGGLNAVLPKAFGIVEGTVFNNSIAIGDVIVELSSGIDPRSTVTATSPPGAYRFADVAPGDYTLTFRRDGLATRVAIITVAADVTVRHDIDIPAGS